MALKLPRNLRRVGGLWEVTSERGHRYFRGGTRGQKLYVFANGEAGPDAPPWLLYVDDGGEPRQPIAAAEQPARNWKPRTGRKRYRPVAPPAQVAASLPSDPLEDLFPGPSK